MILARPALIVSSSTRSENDRPSKGTAVPWHFRRAGKGFDDAIAWMRLGHAAQSVLRCVCQWLHGASDRYELDGVPLTVRRVANACRLSRSVAHRDGFAVLLSRGVLVTAPDPSRPDNPKAKRYHLRHPAFWSYPEGLSVPAWRGPEPQVVAPFGPVLLWPRGWRKQLPIQPVGGPVENSDPVSSSARTPRGRDHKKTQKEKIDLQAQKIDSFWLLWNDPRGRPQRFPLVDAVECFMREQLGESWRQFVPSSYRGIPAPMVARVAEFLVSRDARPDWNPPVSWVRGAIHRLKMRTQDEEDAKAVADLAAYRTAIEDERKRRASAADLVDRWGALDEQAAELGTAGLDLDDLEGRAGDSVAALWRQVRASVAVVASGDLVELEIAQLLADDLGDALAGHLVGVRSGVGTDVLTLLDFEPEEDAHAVEVATVLEALDEEPPEVPPELQAIPGVAGMRARLPWLKWGGWRRRGRDHRAALGRNPGCAAVLTRARQHLGDRPEIPGPVLRVLDGGAHV